MSTSKVTGVVDGISDYRNKDFYNIALDDADKDDNWYIGDGTLRDYGDISKGDKVRLHVDDNQGSVTKVDVMEDGDGEIPDSSQNSAQTGEGSSPSSKPTYIPPELQVAFKEACKDFREDEGTDDMTMAEEQEFKSAKTAMHYEVLKKVGIENVGKEQ